MASITFPPANHVFECLESTPIAPFTGLGRLSMLATGEAPYEQCEDDEDDDAERNQSEEDSASTLIMFEGTFKEGLRHGHGTLHVGKFHLTCSWENDSPDLANSISHIAFPNGDEYVGLVSMISDGSLRKSADFAGLGWIRKVKFVPDATGEMWMAKQRRRYCGEWQCGQRHGFGVEADASGAHHFIGGFAYDEREGSGAVFHHHQKTVLSASWKDGVVTGPAALHLPNQSVVVQSHSWTNMERYVFETATVVRSRVVDGIWEPLFVAFDNTLALSVTENNVCEYQAPVGIAATSNDIVDRSDAEEEERHPRPSARIKRTVVQLLDDIMTRDNFQSLLATFQRSFYFQYGSCERYLQYHSHQTATERKRRSAEEKDASYDVLFPESWCCLQNLSPAVCIHRQSREKNIDASLFQRAVSDVASFVFSVRLRLLSFLAAIPSACDVNVGRVILQLCWDSAFAAVEPILFHMAHVLTRQKSAALLLAADRCRSLSVADFIGPLHSWLPPVANDGTPAQSPTHRAERATCFDASLETLDRLWEAAIPLGELRAHKRMTSSGPLVCRFAVGPQANRTSIVPSASLQHLQVLFNTTRDMARWLTRDISPNAMSFIHEQLLTYSVLRFARSWNGCGISLDAMVTVLLSLMQDSIDPPLPGTLLAMGTPIQTRGDLVSPVSMAEEEERHVGGSGYGAILNDSLDASAIITSSDSTDVEKQATLQAHYHLQQWLHSSQRASMVSPCFRLHRCLHLVVPMDAVLLRVQYVLKCGMDRPAAVVSEDSSDDDDDDADDAISPSFRFPIMPTCRQMSEALAEVVVPQPGCPHSAVGDLNVNVRDVLLFVFLSPATMLKSHLLRPQKRMNSNSSISKRRLIAASSASTTLVTSTDTCVLWRTLRAPLAAVHWYRDIIPRFSHIAYFLSLLGLRYELQFFSSNGSTRVAPPEEALGIKVTLSWIVCREAKCVCSTLLNQHSSVSASAFPLNEVNHVSPQERAMVMDSMDAIVDEWERAIHSSTMFGTFSRSSTGKSI